MTARRPFTLIAAAIFLLMALGHLYRLATGLEVAVAGNPVPQWPSMAGIAIAGLLAAMLYREARR